MLVFHAVTNNNNNNNIVGSLCRSALTDLTGLMNVRLCAADLAEHNVCVVLDIPSELHCRDLRCYFAAFVEQYRFKCFHYRHRPQPPHFLDESEDAVCSKNDAGCDNNVAGYVKNDAGCDNNVAGYVKNDAGCDNNVAGYVKNDAGCAKIDGSGNGDNANARVNVAVVCLSSASEAARFVGAYSHRHWVDANDDHLPQRCRVLPLTACAQIRSHLQTSMSGCSPGAGWLAKLIEFRPPADVLPHGNVGTPTAHLTNLIKQCRLPTRLILSLGLSYEHKYRQRRRQFGCVPLDYGTAATVKAAAPAVRTASGVALLERLDACLLRQQQRRRRRRQRETMPQTTLAPRASDTLDAEEPWSLATRLQQDVTGQHRNKERLYEEPVELVWEKGGPGLVWHTDAAFWRRHQRDVDDDGEHDDWDVVCDLSDDDDEEVDADTRQLRDVRRLRERHEASVFSGNSRADVEGTDADVDGASTSYCVDGRGRRMLKQLGWRRGQTLGRRPGGLLEPLAAIGQRNRRGIGYPQQLPTALVRSKLRPVFLPNERSQDYAPAEDFVRIGTAFDGCHSKAL